MAKDSARRLNTVICERAYDSDALQFLASPVSGSGVAIPQVAQLFLLAAMRGFKEPRQWAEFAQSALNGTQENDRAANMPDPLTPDHELVEKAVRFAEVFVPALKMLLIGEVD